MASWCTFILLVTHRVLVTTFPPSHLNLTEELNSEFTWFTHICWDGEYHFFLAPHVNYSPLWAVQNCFWRGARNTSALSEQMKGELSNAVVLKKREISASWRLFTDWCSLAGVSLTTMVLQQSHQHHPMLLFAGGAEHYPNSIWLTFKSQEIHARLAATQVFWSSDSQHAGLCFSS